MFNVISPGTPATADFQKYEPWTPELFVRLERQNYGVFSFIIIQAPNIFDLHTIFTLSS